MRKALGEDVLETSGAGYVLRVHDGELDVWRFEQLVDQGRRTLAAGDPARAATFLRHALALWHGPALADVMYEAFAQAEAARLEELRLRCLEARSMPTSRLVGTRTWSASSSCWQISTAIASGYGRS